MRCDIIIPIWNQLEFTKDCIDSIARNTGYPYRLILIDNASDKDTRDYLESVKNSKSLDVILIRNEKNAGFIKAVNQGLNKSDAPYVCIMNNDTIPAHGWLNRMVDFAESHPDAGLINPQCNGHMNSPIEVYAKSLEKNKGVYMEMNQCQGFCMLVKRELINKIGLLDEAFGIGGFDDTDYSMRAHKAGYKSVSIYDSYVYHRLHASFNKSGDREDWVARNQKIYYDKWGKHLRVGLPVSVSAPDDIDMTHLTEFAYGLAREWAWVYIWINCNADKDKIKKAIDEAIKAKGFPIHQNISIKYLNLPDAVFNLTVLGKLFERMRRRFKDKRFDAIIAFDEDRYKFFLSFKWIFKTFVFKVLFDGSIKDWQVEGKNIAVSIKEKRDLCECK